jgi:hypothetical protein
MKNEFLSHLRDNPVVQYAVKHLYESNLAFHGDVTCDHYRDGKLIHTQTGRNTFTTEGMAYLLNVMFYTTSKAGSAIFYVGIYHNAVTPATTSTAAACLGAAGTFGESQDADYSTPATNKPSYVTVSTATAVCTNAAAPASFTIAQGFTAYGAFLSTAAAKTATSGTLMAAKLFGTARAVSATDVLGVTYVISATTS